MKLTVNPRIQTLKLKKHLKDLEAWIQGYERQLDDRIRMLQSKINRGAANKTEDIC